MHQHTLTVTSTQSLYRDTNAVKDVKRTFLSDNQRSLLDVIYITHNIFAKF